MFAFDFGSESFRRSLWEIKKNDNGDALNIVKLALCICCREQQEDRVKSVLRIEFPQM